MATMRTRRGSVAVTFALMLATLFGVGSLGIDRNMLQVRDFEAQNAADAVAHAAARQLDGTSAGMERAISTAQRVAGLNYVGVTPVTLGAAGAPATASMEFGRWAGDRFVAESTDPRRVNAVRVTVTRLGIPTLFAEPGLGIEELGAEGVSIAVGGGVAQVPCPLPLAIPSCMLPQGELICGFDLVLNADGNDNSGWANLGGSRPSSSSVRSAIESCSLEGVDTTETVTMNNGAVSSAMQVLADAVGDSPILWDDEEWGVMPPQSAQSGVKDYGHVLEGHLIVFDDPANCDGTKFNGANLPVTGFVSGIVYDVDTKGNVNQRRIGVRLVCEVEPNAQGGGGYYGTTAPPHFVVEP